MTSSRSLTPKCDPEAAAKTEQIVKWILAGHSEFDILEGAAASWPDTDPAPFILGALEKIRKGGTIDPDMLAGWCVEATRELYRRMVEIGDFTGALRAIRQLADLAKQ